MNILYPEIEPYQHDWFDVGDHNRIYYEQCGNPNGKPVVVLHGGPGSGCTPRMRRFFNPRFYRIVLIDQRGCGRSQPHASDLSTDLLVNTIWHLVADLEHLREHLGIDRWMIYGGSWGSTLGLVYAETHPQCISEIILWGVAMTRPSEIDWLYRGLGLLLPEEYARFTRGVPEADRQGDLVQAYFRLLNDPDAAVRLQAARDFHAWEWAQMNVMSNDAPTERWLNPKFQLARGRIVTHYFRNKAWLEDEQILRRADRLAGIPGILAHGRFDIGSPLKAAWELAQAWRDSELIIVRGAGHSTSDPGMEETIIAATERMIREA